MSLLHYSAFCKSLLQGAQNLKNQFSASILFLYLNILVIHYQTKIYRVPFYYNNRCSMKCTLYNPLKHINKLINFRTHSGLVPPAAPVAEVESSSTPSKLTFKRSWSTDTSPAMSPAPAPPPLKKSKSDNYSSKVNTKQSQNSIHSYRESTKYQKNLNQN